MYVALCWCFNTHRGTHNTGCTCGHALPATSLSAVRVRERLSVVNGRVGSRRVQCGLY